MTTDRDPNLVELFARAEESFDDDAFVAGFMGQIDRERRKIVVIWVVLGLAIAACVALLASPLIAAVSLVTQLLPASVIDIQAGWLRQFLAPVNSVAAIAALGILGIAWFFRKIFR